MIDITLRSVICAICKGIFFIANEITYADVDRIHCETCARMLENILSSLYKNKPK